MNRAMVAALAVALLWGCRDSQRGATGGAADSAPAASGSTGGVQATGAGYELNLPLRWQGHIRLDTLSTAERGLARRGALNFLYLPSDSTQRPQTLAVMAVYDAASWRAVRREGGPPPGDSIAVYGGLIYVVGLPQSNPFAPGSPDAILFDILQLRPGEIGGLVRAR